ncbi:hypothetical protein J2X69_002054 [Algoriphagus sp. 4150]|uniref:hypothetical protein n=1 Tax=Algoriphagus sp. 4150 TaxID=2817756 RepID=UPI002858C7A4|nr:hypothetical protein [Algoriphagus sp. 4150]MDR7129709.1 hypothetical protein [Algoriphagus sp. 4150]
MNFKTIDFGKVLLKVLDLIIVKPFTLPLKIYYNSLNTLSDSGSAGTEESELSPDFPLYTWYVRIFDALIALVYPAGLLMAIGAGTNSFTGGFAGFLGVISITYFLPLALGFVRELVQITLKMLLYLKIISTK